ncbi:MAG: hypothetical protein ACTHJ3_17385 [Pararhizobium sp.]
MRILKRLAAAMAFAAVVSGAAAPAIAAEQPVAPEKNPPGDIPDTQVFITYHSPDGFSLKVPEGWARTDLPNGAKFVSRLDGVVVTASPAKSRPTVQSVRDTVVPEMKAKGHAVKVTKVETVKLPAGEAIRIVYSSNSAANPVTDKKVRLEDNRYLYYANGKVATLDLYAPYGADNVDQWRLMSRSFRWK